MAAYAILKSGSWVDVAEWDSISDWVPPDNALAILIEDGEYNWDGSWTYKEVVYIRMASSDIQLDS